MNNIFFKCAIWFFLLQSSALLTTAQVDSLLTLREAIRIEYVELISSPRTSDNTVSQIFYLQNKLIDLDDLILKNYLENALLEKDKATQLLLTTNENKLKLQQKNEELNSLNKTMRIVIICILSVILILLIFLVVVLRKKKITNNNLRNYESLITGYNKKISDLTQEIEILRADYQTEDSEYESLKRKITDYERKVSESHIKFIQQKNEIEKLEKELEILKGQDNKPMNSEIEIVSKEEILALEHQLHDSRAKLQDLTETNRILSFEIEKLIQREKNLDQENIKFQDEIIYLKTQLEYSQNKLEAETQKTQYQAELQNDPEDQITSLKKVIDEYKNRLNKEEQARKKLESEVNQILEDFIKYIDDL